MVPTRSLKLIRCIWVIALGLAIFLVSYDYLYYNNFKDWFSQRHNFSVPDRTITALIVVDETIVTRYPNSRWQDVTRNLLGNVSKIFESQVGIRIVPCGYLEWGVMDVARLQTLSAKICDIKIGITARPFYADAFGRSMTGYATYDPILHWPYDTVLITTYPRIIHSYSLAHEIAHLFYARHKSGHRLLMGSTSQFSGPRIDDENWRVIIRHKWRDFQKDQLID